MRVMGDQVFTMKCAIKSKYIIDYRCEDYYYRYNPTSVVNTTNDASEYIIKCVNHVYRAMKEDGMTIDRSYYLENHYLPIKMEMLVAIRLKSRGSKELPLLDHDINIYKYLRTVKYKLAYLFLKTIGRI